MSYLESNLSRIGTTTSEDHSASSSPVRRPRRKNKRKYKGRVHISEDSDTESSESVIPLVRKRITSLRSKVATTSDSGLDALDSCVVAPRKQRSEGRDGIRLEDLSDRESETPVTDMTYHRKVFLRHLIDRLSKEHDEDSEPFAKPVDAVAEDVPDYHEVIERGMDLRTLNENLGKGFYKTVENFEADFNLMIENSIRFNGLTHEVSQGGLRLLSAFNVSMASLPGRK